MADRNQQFTITARRDAFFERLLQQHATLLYKVAYSVLRNPADAEDAVADAVLKLLRTEAWERIEKERAFLTRAVWRAALDRVTTRPPAATGIEEATSLSNDDPSPLRQSTAHQQWQRLHACIDALPHDLQQPLLLSAVDELTSREIGEILHLPEGTVRTRLMRARALLRQQTEVQEANLLARAENLRGAAQ